MKERKHQNITKRKTPSKDLLNWRETYLSTVKDIKFDTAYSSAPLLEPGNSKIGLESKYYQKVFVWNLPVVITCPSASQWCLRHCYNADLRTDKYPINEWNKNLQFYINDKDKLESILLNILQEENVTKAVRIHSSGDFFENEYVNFWKRIIEKTPEVRYWAYTRSWTGKSLLNTLEELKRLKNIQLFASWDKSMPNPPKDWRKSIVYNQNEIVANTGIICPEQSGLSPNCATCNYCIAKKRGDVYFILH